MELYISRGIRKVISWAAEVFVDVGAYFLLLIASTAIASILMFLILILNFIFQELGQELGLEFVLIPDSTSIMYILIFLFFIILYSIYIESKFIKYTISVRRILILVLPIIFIIVCWRSLSSGAFQVSSELYIFLLYFILYIFLLVCMVWWSIMTALLFRGAVCDHMVNTHFKRARSAVDKLVESQNDEKCLFEWDDIPGKDSEKLASYLREDRDIGWVESKNIHKSKGDKSINISKDENSIKITIDDKKGKGILEINNARICDLKIKKENGKLHIHEVKSYKDMYRIYRISDDYKSGLNAVKDLLRRGIDLNRNSNLNQVLDQLAFSMQYYLLYGGSEQIESVKKTLRSHNQK